MTEKVKCQYCKAVLSPAESVDKYRCCPDCKKYFCLNCLSPLKEHTDTGKCIWDAGDFCSIEFSDFGAALQQSKVDDELHQQYSERLRDFAPGPLNARLCVFDATDFKSYHDRWLETKK